MIKCPAFLGPEHYFTDNCNLTREVLSQYQSDLQVKENNRAEKESVPVFPKR